MQGEPLFGKQRTQLQLYRMKKNFPVGDWFPAPLQITKFEASIESSSDNNHKKNTVYHPFQIIPFEENQVVVSYGSVNNTVPNNVSPLPEEGTKFSMGDGDKLYLKAELGNENVVTSVSIQKSEPNDSDSVAGKLIGEVYVENNSVIGVGQAIINSLGLFSCGDRHYWVNS